MPVFTETPALSGLGAAAHLLAPGGPLASHWTDISPIANWLIQYQHAHFRWGVAPLPTFPKGRRTQADYVSALVSRHTRQPDLAARFVLSLYSSHHQRALGASGAGMPVPPAEGAALLQQLLPGHVQGVATICDPTEDVPPNEALGVPTAGNLTQRLLLESDLANVLDALYRGLPMTTPKALSLAADAIRGRKDLSCTQSNHLIASCGGTIGTAWPLYGTGLPAGM